MLTKLKPITPGSRGTVLVSKKELSKILNLYDVPDFKRKIHKQKIAASGGILFYETFNVDYLKYSSFKKEWVLEQNELLEAFNDFRILRYQEVDEEPKAFASLIAQKL